jgi:hypothetical protein
MLQKSLTENNKKVQTSLSNFEARLNSNTVHQSIVTGLIELMKQSVFCEYNLKEEKEELTKLIKVLESRLTTMAQKMKNSREKTEYY